MPKSRLRLRALVLTAGRGTRLAPLTDRQPKPLIPVLGRPLVAATLDRLAALGCEAIALNLHHLGDQIRARFGPAHAGVPLTYSEEPELLGTLGALAPLRSFLSEADAVLVVNGDSLCRWPLAKMVARHARRRPGATLLLARRPDPRRFGGGVGVDRKGRVVSFRRGGKSFGKAERRAVFAGAHVLSPDLLSEIERRPSDIVSELYEPHLEAGGIIETVSVRRRWHDLGTPRRYRDGLLFWARGPRPWSHTWTSPSAEVSSAAKVKASIVEEGAVIAPGAEVERAVVMPGARVEAGARLIESVLGPEARLPAGARIEGRLVTAARAGAVGGPRDSVVGELVISPLDPAPRRGGG